MKKYIQYALRPGTGRTLPQASVEVKANPSTGLSPVATIYDVNDAIPANEIAQPFLCSPAGMLEFYAPTGRYDIYITYEDISYTLTDVYISDDLSVGAVGFEGLHLITTQAEAALTDEIVIPTFLGHPDIPPASPHAKDDEFGGSLSVNWVEYNGSGTFANVNSRLHYTSSTAETGPCVGLELTQTIPDSTLYRLNALVRFGCSPGHSALTGELTGDKPFWGIGIRTDASDIIAFGLRSGAQGISVSYMRFDATDLVESETCHLIGSNACYLRMTISDYDNLKFEWSTEGLTWVLAKRIIAQPFSGIPTKIGFYAYNELGGTEGSVEHFADFFRVQLS